MTNALWPSQEQVAQIRAKYPVGTRIRLDLMSADPCPIPPGTAGTITHVDDAGSLGMQWDISRSLSIIPGIDQFTIIK